MLVAGQPAPGHRAGGRDSGPELQRQQPAGAFSRAAPGAEACLEHARHYVIGLIPVVYLEPLEVSFVLRLIKNVWIFQLMFPGFPFFFQLCP